MAEQFDQEERLEVVTRGRTPGRAWVVVFFLWFLVAAGAAAGYLWLNYDGLISALPIQRTDAPPEIVPEVSASLRDLRSVQQQTAREIETIQQTLVTQQADLNRISEQLSALASRLDAVQSAPPLRSTLTPPQPGARARPPNRRARRPPGRPSRRDPYRLGAPP